MLDVKPDAKGAMPVLDLPLTENVQESFTLPASWYTDPDIYEREKEAIFYRTWQYVGHKGFFKEPGDYMTVKICEHLKRLQIPASNSAVTAGTGQPISLITDR